MNEYMFGVSHSKPTRREARRMERIAKKHGAYLVEYTEPGCGCGHSCRSSCPARYKRWFCARNYGEPFNSATARAVLAEIGGAS